METTMTAECHKEHISNPVSPEDHRGGLDAWESHRDSGGAM